MSHSRRYGLLGTIYSYVMGYGLMLLALMFLFDMVTGCTPKARYEWMNPKEEK